METHNTPYSENKEVENQEEYNYNFRRKDDVGGFVSRFVRIAIIHKYLFLIVAMVVLLLVILYGMKKPSVYQAAYQVFYNENLHELVEDNTTTVVKSDFDKNYWLKAMQSDEIMRLTLRNSMLKMSPQQLKSMLTVDLVDKRKEDRIPIFLILIVSRNREEIPRIIQAYIKSLNDMLIESQIHNSERLIGYLTGQLNDSNQKLNTMDLQIKRGGDGATFEIIDFDKVKNTLDDFRKDLLNARVNLSSIQSSRKKTEVELKRLDGTIVNESAFSEPLKVQLMNLEVDLARALTKNKEEHPNVIQIKKNIQQISKMLKDSLEQRLEIKSMVANPLKSQLMGKLLDLQIQEVSEESKVSSLEQVIAELERKTMPNAVDLNQQQQLRNREMLDVTIKQLNEKLLEAQSASHGSLSRFVYIDDPSAIHLANRGLMFYILFGLLLSLIVASLVVFIYDLLDDRLMMIEDYEHFYQYPLVGVMRYYSEAERAQVYTKNDNQSSNGFNDIGGLVVRLRQAVKHNHMKTILFTSPSRQEGKSLVSLKVSSALAAKKQKILLVDMDFFIPKLTESITGDAQTTGLSNYLLDEVSYRDIIRDTEIESLKFIGAGNGEGQKELFYNDSRLGVMIDELKSEFDLIIFDTPAAMCIPDIVELYETMDCILIVARLRRTTRKMLDKIVRLTNSFSIKYIGVVLNDLRSWKNNSYYYNYDYQYYYSDKKDDK